MHFSFLISQLCRIFNARVTIGDKSPDKTSFFSILPTKLDNDDTFWQ